MDGEHPKGNDPSAQFIKAAGQRRGGVLGELGRFLMHNKKWWLAPILVLLLLLGLVIFLSGSAIGPFLYTFY